MKNQSLRFGLRSIDAKNHFPLLGELHGVSDQIREDLNESAEIADQSVGHILADVEDQLQSCLCRPDAEGFDRDGQCLAERKGSRTESELACFDFGEIENV